MSNSPRFFQPRTDARLESMMSLNPVVERVSRDCYELFTNRRSYGPMRSFRIQGRSVAMARLPKDIIVTSKPVQTFPNGDYLYVELSRTNSHYDCFVKMSRSTDPAKTLLVAKAQGRTIREAEDKCYERALNRSPRFPRPPYLKRGSGASRTHLKST